MGLFGKSAQPEIRDVVVITSTGNDPYDMLEAVVDEIGDGEVYVKPDFRDATWLNNDNVEVVVKHARG